MINYRLSIINSLEFNDKYIYEYEPTYSFQLWYSYILTEKWLNQPLPLTEISYQAPSNLFNFDNTTTIDIIDVSNAPIIPSLSNEPIQIICSKVSELVRCE